MRIACLLINEEANQLEDRGEDSREALTALV
jgi:hypothetical protein